MKVQILVTKKVPGAKSVEWPKVPEWIWSEAQRTGWNAVFVEFRGCTAVITGANQSAVFTGKCYRLYNRDTRKVLTENITDGPWLIQEPDREVPLTVEEMSEKFPASDWLLMAIRGHDFGGIDFRALKMSCDGGQPATIIALNRHTFETVKIAEVVE